MAATSIIRVIVTGDAKGLQRAAVESTGALENIGKSSGKVGALVSGGFASIGAAAIAFGADSLKASDAFETAQARLQTAVKNTGGSWDKYSGQIQSALDHGTDFGFHVGDTENALASMTTGMGSTTQALGHLQLAEDIAKATGKDLGDTALLVTKAYEGNTRALKQLGIDLPIASTNAAKLVVAQKAVATAEDAVKLVEEKIHDGRLKGPAAADALAAATTNLKNKQDAVTAAQRAGSQITDALTNKYKGSAAAAAKTFAGQTAEIGAKFDQVKVKVGLAIENGLEKFATWVHAHQQGITQFGVEVAALAQGFYQVEKNAAAALGPLATFAKDAANLTSIIPNIPGIGSLFGTGKHITLLPGSPGGIPNPPGGGVGNKRAAGGPVMAGMSYLVGERGPELFTPGRSGAISPNGALGTVTFINYWPAGTDPDAVVSAQARYNRRNGL